jgi:hypothetical protein
VPLSPDLGGSEHTTGTALVTERSLTSTVSTTTRDTRDTSDGTTCTQNKYSVEKLPSQLVPPMKQISTYRYPRTQRKSVHQPSRSRHKAVSCSSPYRCEPAYNQSQPDNDLSSISLPRAFLLSPCSFWIVVGILDDIRTDGRSEDSRQGQSSPAGLAISRGDSDGRAGRHCCRR